MFWQEETNETWKPITAAIVRDPAYARCASYGGFESAEARSA